MDWIADLRLTDGPVYWTALILGITAGISLLLRPNLYKRRRWVLSVAGALAGAGCLLLVAHWVLVYVVSAIPDELPLQVLARVFPAVAAFLLLLLRLSPATGRRRGLDVVAFLAVVLLSAAQVNAYYGLNRTVSDLTGAALARVPVLEQALMSRPGSRPAPLAGWSPASRLPAGGALRTAAIPATASGLRARNAVIYLPPAYFASNRPRLPVLVLVPGQPGGPADWLTGGSLQPRMDSFAARHGGVAPVVVVVDPNGGQSANNLCMDSSLANADTYMAVDVPAWILATLDVDADHRRWAAGGFSFGATCAVQMGTRHPERYSGVLAFASEGEPALAKERRKTVDAAFRGDTAAFDAQVPLTLMKERRYHGSVAYFAAGSDDPEFVANLRVLAEAARGAGFTVSADEVPQTGHSWDVLTPGMDKGLEFLASHWGWPP